MGNAALCTKNVGTNDSHKRRKKNPTKHGRQSILSHSLMSNDLNTRRLTMKERMPDNLLVADEGSPEPTNLMETPDQSKEHQREIDKVNKDSGIIISREQDKDIDPNRLKSDLHHQVRSASDYSKRSKLVNPSSPLHSRLQKSHSSRNDQQAIEHLQQLIQNNEATPIMRVASRHFDFHTPIIEVEEPLIESSMVANRIPQRLTENRNVQIFVEDSIEESQIIEQKAQKKKSVIIYEWDNTLFPTSFLQHDTDLLKHKDSQIPIDLIEKLAKLENEIRLLLNASLEIGSVYIITNHHEGWIQNCTKRFYSGISDLIQSQTTCISGRDLYERLYPHNPPQWKIKAFHEAALSAHMNSDIDLHNIVCLSSNHLLDIEDAISKDSGLSLTHIKTIQFKEDPSMHDMQKQIQSLLSTFKDITLQEKTLHVKLKSHHSHRGSVKSGDNDSESASKLSVKILNRKHSKNYRNDSERYKHKNSSNKAHHENDADSDHTSQRAGSLDSNPFHFDASSGRFVQQQGGQTRLLEPFSAIHQRRQEREQRRKKKLYLH
ncbi:hypothetical protein FGO68_gene12863 [Halteria grandinella]|uniref:Uncharacterized protein n=1 Tax=Halteria grandinella TaxID=5974 RepID=A0A8J8T2U2_HALGN|nr:hypothetical protein FGO68_gene12863 [Halteria grandinella]